MAAIVCSVCERIVPENDWSCAYCGHAARANAGEKPVQEFTNKGMICMLGLFVIFPVLLFLLHIFVPGM